MLALIALIFSSVLLLEFIVLRAPRLPRIIAAQLAEREARNWHEHLIGIQTHDPIQPGATCKLAGDKKTLLPFMLRRLSIPEKIADGFTLINILIDGEPQLMTSVTDSGPVEFGIPAATFSTAANGMRLNFPVCKGSVELLVRNDQETPADFMAMLLGAVRDPSARKKKHRRMSPTSLIGTGD